MGLRGVGWAVALALGWLPACAQGPDLEASQAVGVKPQQDSTIGQLTDTGPKPPALDVLTADLETGPDIADVQLPSATLQLEPSDLVQDPAVACGGCDDGNPCTDDACDAATKTCSHLPHTGSCDTGPVCGRCVAGKCAQNLGPFGRRLLKHDESGFGDVDVASLPGGGLVVRTGSTLIRTTACGDIVWRRTVNFAGGVAAFASGHVAVSTATGVLAVDSAGKAAWFLPVHGLLPPKPAPPSGLVPGAAVKKVIEQEDGSVAVAVHVHALPADDWTEPPSGSPAVVARVTSNGTVADTQELPLASCQWVGCCPVAVTDTWFGPWLRSNDGATHLTYSSHCADPGGVTVKANWAVWPGGVAAEWVEDFGVPLARAEAGPFLWSPAKSVLKGWFGQATLEREVPFPVERAQFLPKATWLQGEGPGDAVRLAHLSPEGKALPWYLDVKAGKSQAIALALLTPTAKPQLGVLAIRAPDGTTLVGLDPAGLPSCVTHTDCDDGVACTQDACDLPTHTCTATAIDAACDDGSACTVDTCNRMEGQCVHAVVLCDDGDGCTQDACNPVTGCVATKVEGSCVQPGACSVQTCAKGVCQSTGQDKLFSSPVGASLLTTAATAGLVGANFVPNGKGWSVEWRTWTPGGVMAKTVLPGKIYATGDGLFRLTDGRYLRYGFDGLSLGLFHQLLDANGTSIDEVGYLTGSPQENYAGPVQAPDGRILFARWKLLDDGYSLAFEHLRIVPPPGPKGWAKSYDGWDAAGAKTVQLPMLVGEVHALDVSSDGLIRVAGKGGLWRSKPLPDGTFTRALPFPIQRAAWAPGGVLYAVKWDSDVKKAELLRVQDDGTVAWTVPIQITKGISAMAASQDGLVVVGDTGLAHFGSGGYLDWQKPLPQHDSAVPMPDGGWALLTQPYGDEPGSIARVDAWGHPTCQAAGKCGGIAACPSPSPCHTSSCDPAKGCVVTPLPVGTPCGSGKTCQAGGCN